MGWVPSVFERDDAFEKGRSNHLSHAVQVELGHDVPAMGLPVLTLRTALHNNKRIKKVKGIPLEYPIKRRISCF
jgi:hypothetical protein